MPIELLARTPRLADLAPRHANIVILLRAWALLGRQRRCPYALLVGQLGSPCAAARFQLLMEQIGAVWPDPFCVSPPCACLLSYDEATLAEMLAAAWRADRPAFDTLLMDLLAGDARDRLFDFAILFGRTLGRSAMALPPSGPDPKLA
ncbi:MAG TPA: addiction module antidote protein [Allosphingosinicella sp.]|nr:addiction module antidote protein [Allosphingosinicella sp.]